MAHTRDTFEHNHSEWSLKGHNQNTLMPKRITVKDSALLLTLNSLLKLIARMFDLNTPSTYPLLYAFLYAALRLFLPLASIFSVRSYILRNMPMHMLSMLIRSAMRCLEFGCDGASRFTLLSPVAVCIYRLCMPACLRECVCVCVCLRVIPIHYKSNECAENLLC